MLNMAGIKRKEAAAHLSMTPGSLNRKLAGMRRLTPDEEELLLQFAQERRWPK
jgi:hypothetical protein